MADSPLWRPLEEIAHKWSDLAERRRAHFLELYRSGRWTHYYSEREFAVQMRDAIRDADKWARLVGSSQVMREAAE